jgi:hypothetical protein
MSQLINDTINIVSYTYSEVGVYKCYTEFTV